MIDSKFATILAYALTVSGGFAGWYVSTFIATVANGFYVQNQMKFAILDGLFSLIIFLFLGAFFGLLFSKLSWKLGLSLASFVFVFCGYAYWIHLFLGMKTIFSGTGSFGFILLALFTFPELIGGCFGAYLGAEYRNRRVHKGDF